MRSRIIFIVLSFVLIAVSQSFAAWNMFPYYTGTIAATLSNPGVRTTFSTYDFLQSTRSMPTHELAILQGTDAATNVNVISAPSTVTLTRVGGTETATATIDYRVGSPSQPASPVDGSNANLGASVVLIKNAANNTNMRFGAFITKLTFLSAPVSGKYISSGLTYTVTDGTLTQSIVYTVTVDVKNDTFTITELRPLKLTLNRKLPLDPTCYSAHTMARAGIGDNCFEPSYYWSNSQTGVVSITGVPSADASLGARYGVRIIPNSGAGAVGNYAVFTPFDAGAAHVFTGPGGATITMQELIWKSEVPRPGAGALTDCGYSSGIPAEAVVSTVAGGTIGNSYDESFSFCWGIGSADALIPRNPMVFSNTANGNYYASYTIIVDVI